MSFHVRKIGDEKKAKRDWFGVAAKVLTVAQPLVGLYSVWSARKKEEEEHNHRIALLKRIFAISFSVLLIAVLLVVIAQTVFSINFSLKSIFFTAAGAELPVDERGYTNILLIGTGDEGHSGVDLTDTIIVASLDPRKTKSVVMLSIPRDSYVVQSEMGVGRINSLYRNYKSYLMAQGESEEEAAMNSLKMFEKTISEKINLPIHRVVKVNFSGFTEAIDALGGIDVFVEEDLYDTQYPGPNYTYETFAISQGLHHLDGETALKYVRSRHSTSDFSRSARQQQVITAAAEKAKAMNILTNVGKLTELYRIFSKNTLTDMTLSEIIGAAEIGDEIDRSRIVSMQISAYGPGGFLFTPPREEFDGASVLLPTSNKTYGSWDLIQIFSTLIFHQRGYFLMNPRIVIANAGAAPGAAGLLAAELERYGFNVVDTGNADKVPLSSISSRPLPEGEKDPFESSLTFLTGLLQMSPGTQPTGLTTTEPTDLTIVLGENYRFTPIENLVPEEWTRARVASEE